MIALSNGGCELVHQEQSGLSEADLRFLSAKGLLDLTPAGDNEFWAELTPSGLTYFSEKAESRARFVKEHLVNFFSGFISGVLVTICAAWLMQVLL